MKNKKNTFIVIILLILYCLFINLFSMKVHALDLGTPDSLHLYTNYSSGSLGNASGYNGWESSDITKFKISDDYNTEQDFEYNIVANYSGQANIRAKGFTSRKFDYYKPVSNHYFVFSVYSRIKLDTVNAYVGDDYLTSISNITCQSYETVSNSDSPHYFYNFNCNTENINRAIYYIGIRFHNDDDKLYSPINFGISNFYSFDSEAGANDFFTSLVDTTSNLTNEDVAAIDNVVRDILGVLKDDNIDNKQANDFFSDFSSNTPNGLVSLIHKPLDFLNGLYNSCSPLSFDIPYFNFTLTLPCISSIHNDIFDAIIPIARIIINGFICYRLVLGFINVINKLKDPNDSDIEVVDL